MYNDKDIRIGNQTAYSALPAEKPFLYAIECGFDAFEWFPDKKDWGEGWVEDDIVRQERCRIRLLALKHDIRLSVHAPVWANPLRPDALDIFRTSISFACDIGAELLNFHLHTEQGLEAYVNAIIPVIKLTHEHNLRLSIENTIVNSPDEFNDIFSRIRHLKDVPTSHLGMCIDVGHANIYKETRNNYIAFVDKLDRRIPVIHVHMHENYGDRDTHLTIFTGPAGQNPAGVRILLERLKDRGFQGSVILEQWPDRPELLLQARTKLLELYGPVALRHLDYQQKPLPTASLKGKEPSSLPTRPALLSATPCSVPAVPEIPAAAVVASPFIAGLVDMDRKRKSWKEKLEGLCAIMEETGISLGLGECAALAAYLYFLTTGKILCQEDGRHYRPSHHAMLSRRLHVALMKHTSPEKAFIIQKIHSRLPSYDGVFTRAEPLTRIRDIAHRNDIPRELKNEIKHTLQNKLHRCAGPEDLATSQALLDKVTAAKSLYSPEFIAQLSLFHRELQEFFNASTLEDQLKAVYEKDDPQEKELIQDFLASKEESSVTAEHLLRTIKLLTLLRQRLIAKCRHGGTDSRCQRLRSADSALESHSFVLFSALANAIPKGDMFYPFILRSLIQVVHNIALAEYEPQELQAITAELAAWSREMKPSWPEHLLRLKATLERVRRLASRYIDRIGALFLESARATGQAFALSSGDIAFFIEDEIRRNLVFQLSRFADHALDRIRTDLRLPAWDVLVAGTAEGTVCCCNTLETLDCPPGAAVIALVPSVQGDEDIPCCLLALIIGRSIPHLSHLALRARQRKVILAVCEEEELFARWKGLAQKRAVLDASSSSVTLAPVSGKESGNTLEFNTAKDKAPVASLPDCRADGNTALRTIPEAILSGGAVLCTCVQATPSTAGAKASNAGRLEALCRESGTDFTTPPGLVLTFQAMEEALSLSLPVRKKYNELVRVLDASESPATTKAQEAAEELALITAMLPVPPSVIEGIRDCFKTAGVLMVRSSSNGEDLVDMAGAGLYESHAAFHPHAHSNSLVEAIQKVWASLWTKRAVSARSQAGIPHRSVHMAILIQEMIPADLSFIMNTRITNTSQCGRKPPQGLSMELAVGMGETLASAKYEGSPYRIVVEDGARVISFASFSHALLPGPDGLPVERVVDYSTVPFTTDEEARRTLCTRLAAIGRMVEKAFGGAPQDMEGVVQGESVYLVQSRPLLLESSRAGFQGYSDHQK